MSCLDPDLLNAIAKATSVPQATAARIISMYRELAETITDEGFDWRAVSHMCGGGFSCHVYVAEGTRVIRQIETSKRGSRTTWGFNGKPYDTFGEARRAELRAKPGPTGDGVIIEYAGAEQEPRL